MEAIIFDLDGTLYQTEKVAVEAFRKTFAELQAQGWVKEIPQDEVFESVFGLTGAEFWPQLLPDVPLEVRAAADYRLLQWELDEIEQGRVNLYPHVKETLDQLQAKGYSLFIASNGLKPYVEAVLKAAELDHLFRDIFTASEYRTASKSALVKLCIEKHEIEKGVMVGDRRSDVLAGKENQLLTIACHYHGFRTFAKEDEWVEADHVIQHFSDLLQIMG